MAPWSSVEVGPCAFGLGLYARRAFQPGQSILTFEGPELSHEQILELGEDQAYALQIGPDRYIDTIPPGRYTNHSCNPNAGLLNDRLLIALRSITPGEQIQFDYSTTMSENHWTMECRCGEPCCRRVVLDFHHLPVITQNRYLQLGVVQRFIMDEVRRRCPARRVARRRRSERRATG
jgi:hypothetical protein